MRGEFGWVGVQTLSIEPGSLRENGYSESLNGKLRDELLERGLFFTLPEPKDLIEQWRQHDNSVRPHSALDYLAPTPEAMPWPSRADHSAHPLALVSALGQHSRGTDESGQATMVENASDNE